MRRNVIKKVITGVKGYWLWKRITWGDNLNTDNYFLVYPGEEHQLVYMEKYLYSYMYDAKAGRCHFLVADKAWSERNGQVFSGNVNVTTQELTVKQANLLLAAYWYGVLSDKLMILSISKLYGRNLNRFCGINKISEEEAFVGGLLNILIPGCEKGRSLHRTKWKFPVRD